MEKNKIVIIDGFSAIYRAFYAIPLLSSHNGQFTNAVYGFAKLIIDAMEKFEPTHVVVAFDTNQNTFRKQMFDSYKATRKPMPEELALQLPIIDEMLEKMKIKRVSKEGYEADDIIGTLSKRFADECVIITGDRDSFQLIDESTSVCYMKKGLVETELLTPYNLKAKFGYEPSQVVDLKAIQGDKSDNIPGVEGIGEKGAMQLLDTFGTLDNVYANISNPQINTKLRDKLVAGKEIAFLSKKLATIDTNVDIDCSLDDCKLVYPFSNKLRYFFEELNMKTLLSLKYIFEEKNSQNDDLNEIENIHIIENVHELKQVLNNNANKKQLALYVKSNLHFAFDSDKEYVIVPSKRAAEEKFNAITAVKFFKQLIEDDSVLKIYADAKDFFYRQKWQNVGVSHNIFDVSIATNVCEGIVIRSGEDIFNFFHNGQRKLASGLIKDYEHLCKIIDEKKLYDLIYNKEFRLIFTLFNMEQTGFTIDENRLQEMANKYKKLIDDLNVKIKEIAGSKFNPNSPKQLSDLLFNQLKLPNISRGSTGVEVLEKLLGMHEIIPLILEHRKASKFYSTYLFGMQSHIDEDSKIRTTFNQALTATGRLSSSEPNMQNIPIRSDEGREIRSLFTASDANRVLIDADYSQIELRVLAHLSNDEFYIKAFKNGEDIHTKTACEVFKVEPSQVTSVMRRIAKVVNFGVVYGISQFGLSADLNITSKDAKQYIDDFYAIHPNIAKYMESQIKMAKEKRYVQTMGGRIRLINNIGVSNAVIRKHEERTAQNTAIQGTAAEIIKNAMIAVEDALIKEGVDAKLIMQVHDELVIDCAKKDAERVKKILQEKMENAVKLDVPLTVAIEEGFRWGDVH